MGSDPFYSNATNRITHDKFLFFSTYLLYYQSSMLDCQRSNSGQYKIKPERLARVSCSPD